MGKLAGETCSVCQENASRYRCPGCAAPYCSLACNKVHKNGSSDRPPCSGKSERSEGGHGDHGGESGKRPRGCEEGTTSGSPTQQAPCVRLARDQWRGGKIEEDVEEEWQMSSDQKARISGCGWLKAALRDPKLQELLKEIDGAEDREASLAFHRTNPQFGEFMDKLLLEIEEYRKGGPDEPELIAAEA